MIAPAPIEDWLRARSVARALPQPVRDASGALRLESDVPGEARRYLFVEADAALAAVANAVAEPAVFLKVCAPATTVAALIPARWRIGAESFVMTREADGTPSASLPPGYQARLAINGDGSSVHVLAADGSLAASGFAAEAHGVFVYDRIVVTPAHRRRGLGRAMMDLLGARRRDPGAREILVATAEGRSLYETIGWIVRSPYTSAVIPDAAIPG